MSALMQTAGRGRKHRCAACGAAFYDLERELSACPKCDTPYAEAAHMPRGEPSRKRQSWSKSAQRPEPEAPAAEARQEDAKGAVLDAVDDAEDAEETDETEETEKAEETDEAAGDP